MENAIWLFCFAIAILLGMADCQNYQDFTATKVMAVGIVILLIVWGILDPRIDWVNWPD